MLKPESMIFLRPFFVQIRPSRIVEMEVGGAAEAQEFGIILQPVEYIFY